MNAIPNAAEESPPKASRVDEPFVRSLEQQALPRLMSSLSKKSEGPRTRILHRVGDGRDRQATPYLVQAYREATSKGIRYKILESLGKLQDPSLLGWWLTRLDDQDTGIQCFAIWALGELRNPKAASRLQEKLWSSNSYIQMTAINALGKTGKRPGLAYELSTFLWDDNVQIRYLAAQALRDTADVGSGPELLNRLKEEPSLEVQDALARALGHGGGSPAVEQLIELLKNPGSQATEHWAEIGLKAADPAILIPALTPLLDGSDFRTQVSAARILSELEIPERTDVAPAWMSRVTRWSKDTDLISRHAALRLLERIDRADKQPPVDIDP